MKLTRSAAALLNERTMPKLTVFDPEVLAEVAKSAIGLQGDAMVAKVTEELKERYPGHIKAPSEWLLSNAGGCMYAFTIFHASLTEYVIIFGTQIGTQGHTGRHRAEVWDYVLDGQLWYFDEDRPFDRLVHNPGDRYYLPAGSSQGLGVNDHAWVLEYGRGIIPAMLPFGLADSVLSTLDFKSVYKTLAGYARFYPPYLYRLARGQARLEA